MAQKQMFESLESRTLLHGGSLGGFFGGGEGDCGCGVRVPASVASDPTIQADVAQMKADKDALKTQIATLADTLKADRAALYAAIKAVDTSALRATLRADAASWRDILKADRNAVRDAYTAGDQTAIDAAKQQLSDDRTAASAALAADAKAIKDAVDNDPAVVAAKAQLATDSAPITTAQATLKTDCDKLKADVQAALAALPTTTTTSSPKSFGDGAGFGGCHGGGGAIATINSGFQFFSRFGR